MKKCTIPPASGILLLPFSSSSLYTRRLSLSPCVHLSSFPSLFIQFSSRLPTPRHDFTRHQHVVHPRAISTGPLARLAPLAGLISGNKAKGDRAEARTSRVPSLSILPLPLIMPAFVSASYRTARRETFAIPRWDLWGLLERQRE